MTCFPLNFIFQDLNFPTPFVGRDGVRRLFEECAESLPPDLLFCIDEITAGDGLAVGVVWHVELGGIPFPNGRGTSYYRIDPHIQGWQATPEVISVYWAT